METWIWLAIAAFLAVDGLTTLLVLRHVRRKRREEAAGGADDLSRQIGLQ